MSSMRGAVDPQGLLNPAVLIPGEAASPRGCLTEQVAHSLTSAGAVTPW